MRFDRQLAWLSRHRIDLGVVAVLCAYSLVSRIITLEPVELSGDPLDYWYFVKQWFYGGEFGKFDHHDARFGIHILLFLVQATLGESAQYTYVAPLFAQTMVVALSYVLTRQISTRTAGVVVGLLLCEYDPYIRASSQIRPGMFSAMYVLLAAISLVAYARARPEKRYKPLVGVVVSMFLAYLTKLPDLFFTPAVLLVMYLTQRRLKDVALFGGLLVVGFLGESLLHFIVVGGTRVSSSFGRGAGPTLAQYSDVLQRFTRYLDDSGRLVFYPFLASGPALLALFHRKKNFPVALTVVLLPASFLLIVTLGVRSLNPIVALQPFHPRYLNGVVPFVLISTVVLLQTVIKTLTSSLSGGPVRSLISPVVSGLLALLVFQIHTADLLRWRAKTKGEVHPFIQAKRAFETLSDAYERGLPILGPSDKYLGKSRFPRSPPLHWAQKGFIHSRLLQNEEGKLPRFDYRKRTYPIRPGARTMYLPRALSQKAVYQAYRDRKCVVRLERDDRFVTVIPAEGFLPPECQRLETGGSWKRNKKRRKRARTRSDRDRSDSARPDSGRPDSGRPERPRPER